MYAQKKVMHPFIIYLLLFINKNYLQKEKKIINVNVNNSINIIQLTNNSIN